MLLVVLLLPRTGRVSGGTATTVKRRRSSSSPIRVLMMARVCAICIGYAAAMAIAVEDAREAAAAVDDERGAPCSSADMVMTIPNGSRRRVI